MKTFILLIGLLTFNVTPLSTISHVIHVYVQPPKFVLHHQVSLLKLITSKY